MLKFATEQNPSIRVLSDQAIEKIHGATLEILASTGVAVRHEKARAMLHDAGASVDGERVRIPAALIEMAIRTAPDRVVLHNRLGEPVMPLEMGRVFFGTGSDTPSTIDPHTKERRRPRRDDVAAIARLCDGLENIDFVMSMGIISDVPTADNYIHGFATMVENTSKPIVFTADNLRDIEIIHKIAQTVAGGKTALLQKPFLAHYAEPITPLIHSPNGVDKLRYCAQNKIPVAYVSGTTAGGAAPVTLAGAISLTNAECLSGLVIHQLASPGAPFIYGANVSVLDMATTACVYGGPEWRLTDAAFSNLAHRYRLPVWGAAGNTDAKVVDAQAGAEAMMSLMSAALSRGNLIHDVGYIESGLCSSMEMIVLANELIRMVEIYTNGVRIDADRLALPVIDAVGPGGHFLDTEHTVRFFRREHFLARLINRDNYPNWIAKGGPDLYEALNARALDLLAEHTPQALSQDIKGKLDQILSSVASSQSGN